MRLRNVETGLAALVQSYRAHRHDHADDELAFFRDMPSLELAIHHAAMAIDRRGKRFAHQRRISMSPLRKAKTLLSAIACELQKCRTFHDLHTRIAEALRPVRGVGELYVDDTALRIGAFLNLSPDHVYVHAGSRMGARALGLDLSDGFLRVSSLPQPLRTLAPREIEDFLCTYKAQLQRAR